MSNHDLIEKAKAKESEKDYEAAIELYRKAFEKDPKNFFLQIELGNLYALTNKFEEAAGCFRRANRRFPDNDAIKEGLGFCLCQTGNDFHNKRNYSIAQAAFEEATFFCPKNPLYLFNLGNAYYAQNNFKKALHYFKKSLDLNADSDTYHNLANTYKKLNDFENAQVNYNEALKKRNYQTHSIVELIQLKQNICDWKDIPKLIENLKNSMNNNRPGKISPFAALSMPGLGSKDHLNIASSWVKSHNIKRIKSTNVAKKELGGKITIAYMSADFRLHPLYFLIKDIFTFHDRKKFEVILLYSGIDDGSSELKEFKAMDVKFIDISALSDKLLEEQITKESIDILIDLSGFTSQSRSMIAAYKPAPITINWLGFPGSMGFYDGKPLYDFLLSDNYIIPKNLEAYYAEKIIKLPNCYQPNISNRPSLKALTKKDYGIEENTFVFASFGQSIKITENIFNIWLDLLKRKNSAILWLLESNVVAQKNLQNYAQNYGVEADRILFAPKIDFDGHIARHIIIDLFLDTFPYNAHTSASDAIWAGCPVITLSGETFASRVAGSILTEIGCEELIALNEKDYFTKALDISSNLDELKRLKNKVISGKNNSTLFKPKKFVGNLESIYRTLLSA